MNTKTRAASALRRAEENGVEVKVYQLSLQWICAVEGQLIHINDLPRLVDECIANKRRDEAVRAQNTSGAMPSDNDLRC